MTPRYVVLSEVTQETLPILRNMFTVYFCELSQWDDGLALNEYGLPVWAA